MILVLRCCAVVVAVDYSSFNGNYLVVFLIVKEKDDDRDDGG